MKLFRKKTVAAFMALMMCAVLTIPSSMAAGQDPLEGKAWDSGVMVYEFLPGGTVYFYSTGGSDAEGYGDYSYNADGTGTMYFPLEGESIDFELKNGTLYMDGRKTWPAGFAHVGTGGTFTAGIGIHSTWAGEELEAASNELLIPDSLVDRNLRYSITRSEFASVVVRLYEAMSNKEAPSATDNPFTDLSDEDATDVLKAYALGIVKGTSATEFTPWGELTREQASTMMTRAYQAAGGTSLDYDMGQRFQDHNKISSWARDSVYFMAANNVLNGVGNNNFAPRNTTTCEQGIVIAYRALINLSFG